MNVEISKKLYEAVNGKTLEELNLNLNDLKNVDFNGFYFKCKDWAFDNFYLSIIDFKINDDLYKCEIADIKDSLGEWNTKYSFKDESNIVAVIKACQWILDNKSKE